MRYQRDLSSLIRANKMRVALYALRTLLIVVINKKIKYKLSDADMEDIIDTVCERRYNEYLELFCGYHETTEDDV